MSDADLPLVPAVSKYSSEVNSNTLFVVLFIGQMCGCVQVLSSATLLHHHKSISFYLGTQHGQNFPIINRRVEAFVCISRAARHCVPRTSDITDLHAN